MEAKPGYVDYITRLFAFEVIMWVWVLVARWQKSSLNDVDVVVHRSKRAALRCVAKYILTTLEDPRFHKGIQRPDPDSIEQLRRLNEYRVRMLFLISKGDFEGAFDSHNAMVRDWPPEKSYQIWLRKERIIPPPLRLDVEEKANLLVSQEVLDK